MAQITNLRQREVFNLYEVTYWRDTFIFNSLSPTAKLAFLHTEGGRIR